MPNEYRERLDLGTGSLVVVELKNGRILVQKPKSDLRSLFGSWSDLTDKKVKEIKSTWHDWNAKNLRRL